MTSPLFPSAPVLLVDDEPAWLRVMKIDLERRLRVNNVILCSDSREVEDILARQPVSLVLLDVTMPYLTGEELLSRIAPHYPDLPVLMLTGRSEIAIAVRCMKLGAFDYFIKTQECDRLFGGIQKAIAFSGLRQENSRLQESLLTQQLRRPEVFAAIITRSRVMYDTFRYIEAIAANSEPVLIEGESGTGKELIARAIHRASRPDGPWVAVNVAGLDDTVFSDTLFGHGRGAYTGALSARAGMIDKAAGGVLFLDEIGDLSPTSQVKLLRLLQDGEYYPLGSDKAQRSSARMVFATNRDLTALQQCGDFRKDLYYRLKVHRIQLPPLRARPEDIPLLFEYFLAEAAQAAGRRKPAVAPEVLGLLQSAAWPGNVRELRAMVFDALGRQPAGRLGVAAFSATGATPDVPPLTGTEASMASRDSASEWFHALDQLPTITAAVEALVVEALRRTNGHQGLAARILGISRPAISKRVKNMRR